MLTCLTFVQIRLLVSSTKLLHGLTNTTEEEAGLSRELYLVLRGKYHTRKSLSTATSYLRSKVRIHINTFTSCKRFLTTCTYNLPF